MNRLQGPSRPSQAAAAHADPVRDASTTTPAPTPPRSPAPASHGALDGLARFMRSPLRAAPSSAHESAQTPTRSPGPTLLRQTAFRRDAVEHLEYSGVAEAASSSQSPRPGAAPVKTYPKATLQWPDGHLSQGSAVKLGKGDYRFQLDQGDPALTARKAAGAAPASLKVEKEKTSLFRRSSRFSPALPSSKSAGFAASGGAVRLHGEALKFDNNRIASGGLKALNATELTSVFENLGYGKNMSADAGAGLKRIEHSAVLNLFSGAVADLARRHPDRPALRNAALALAHPIHLQIGTRPDAARQQATLASGASQTPAQARLAVERLKPGEHIYFPITYGPRGAQHAMGVSVSHIGTDKQATFRLSMTDSERPTPGMFVDVSSRRLMHALPGLVNGTLDQPPRHLINAIIAPNRRKPLRDWLATVSRTGTTQSAYFNGKELRQPVQSGPSCATESAFAFMATVLEPKDYKLAKAACLHVALQMAQQHFAAVGGGADIVARIQQRATNALAGSVVA